MKIRHTLNKTVQLLLLGTSVAFTLAVNAVTWPNVPLGSTTSATPMTMLVAGKDHKFFYEAYNDASDIGGGANGEPDGKLDIRFDPKITYYGLFASELCYEYDDGASEEMFKPRALAGALNTCSTANHWSGNWLNYQTTSRIDALRKVLYGGFREIDTTSRTVLRRAYIPQDAHSWGKEYHSVATDGYDIADYTDLTAPTNTTHRIFFGSLTATAGVNCAVLDDCSVKQPPVLRIRDKVNNDRRIWQWASTERPVLNNSFNGGPTNANSSELHVRVEVCTSLNNYKDCTQYPNNGSPIYKPTGLLHQYGENNSMLFGLMTGSYDNNMSGGRLRKVISSFADEIDANTGIFKSKLSPAGASPIVSTFDNLRIRDFNNGRTDNAYRGGWVTNRAMNQGEFVDWGNPIGEIMYEATRYFAGKKAATTAFGGTNNAIDGQVGLPLATWDDPFINPSQPGVAYCSRPNFLTISDINPSFDSDQLPGSYFSSALPGDLSGLNVTTRATTISNVESTITGQRFFIGESDGFADSAPTAKIVNSLGRIRGLAPEEPTKQGSYYSASVAYYAKTTDLRSDLQGNQSIDNYVVALSSPLPRIEINLGVGASKRLVTMVPFAKSVSGAGISSTAAFQPTNQIVDFYVQKLVNQTPNEKPAENGGRYSAEFQINFEDVEQGADHDMDAIAKYVVKENADGTISVKVEPTYQAGGIQQHMGYIISGTTADGIYLVARDETNSPAYRLNVPAGQTAGYCDPLIPARLADCQNIPAITTTQPTFTFTPGNTLGATVLKDPLWYAAKYGNFNDRNNSNTPDIKLEWDVDNNNVPDSYFLVQNPLKLREALIKAFEGIITTKGSGGNVIANSTTQSNDTTVFQGTFNRETWSGDLEAYAVNPTGVSTNVSWRASENIPAPDSRRITFWSPAVAALPATVPATSPARNFVWAAMPVADRGLLGDDEAVLKYVRGDRSNEIQKSTPTFTGVFRNRELNNVLGDIAHSSPFYVKDTDTVYVGANDGMLHAFNAKTGVEVFAHIPSPMLPKLKALTNPGYNFLHQYFVDGDTVVSSVAQTTRNYLVTSMGRGAKGLFGLDVTDPANFDASKVLWEYADGAADGELGHMLGRPVLAKMKNGDWAVIVGNGYNSNTKKAVLYIFKLSTGDVLAKIDTGVAGDNGMATPGVHLDANGFAETIFAGDLKGNVWKFDVSSANKADWKISSSLGGSPLFQAKDANGNPQPITAPIRSVINPVASDPNQNQGKLFLHFGTGSDFQTGDSANTDPQSWYGLIDQTTAIPGRSALVTRVMGSETVVTGQPTLRSMGTAVGGDMTGKSGFVIDLPKRLDTNGQPKPAERIVTASNYYLLAEPVLIVSSLIPTLDLCDPGGVGFLNAINPFTGAKLAKGFFDVDGDGQFDDDIAVSSIDLGVGKPGEAILIGRQLVVGGSKAVIKSIVVNLGLPSVKGRISWREIIRD